MDFANRVQWKERKIQGGKDICKGGFLMLDCGIGVGKEVKMGWGWFLDSKQMVSSLWTE